MICIKTESQTHTKSEIAGHTIKKMTVLTSEKFNQLYLLKKTHKRSLIRIVNTTFYLLICLLKAENLFFSDICF